MRAQLFGAALVAGLGLLLFRHFESGTPLPGRLAKWSVYMGVSALLGATVSPPWSRLWTFGLPVASTLLHCAWCWRHGIHPLTSEPRDKYRRLRGWTQDQEERP